MIFGKQLRHKWLGLLIMIDTSTGLAFVHDEISFYHGWHGGYVAEIVYRGKTKEVYISNAEKLCTKPEDLAHVVRCAILKTRQEVDRDLARRQT